MSMILSKIGKSQYGQKFKKSLFPFFIKQGLIFSNRHIKYDQYSINLGTFDINKLIIMGQQTCKHYSISNNSNWRLVYENQEHPFYRINPYYDRTYYNASTHQYAEEYFLHFDSEAKYQTYVDQISRRMDSLSSSEDQKNNYHINADFDTAIIYPVKQFINTSNYSLCSTTYAGLLYVEKVELRLSEINDIPLADQLYLLYTTLSGFKILYESAGYFDICEQMIFINNKGMVRVWLNPNLSKIQPYHIHNDPSSDQHHYRNGSQSEMIVKLIAIIEENTYRENSNIVHFRQYLKGKGIFERLSFYRALEQLQFYCRQQRLFVSDCMRSVYELYHEDSQIRGSEEEKSIVYTVQNYKIKKMGESNIKSSQKTHKRTYSNQYFQVNVTPPLSESKASVKSKKSIKYSKFKKQRVKKQREAFHDPYHYQTVEKQFEQFGQRPRRITHEQLYEERQRLAYRHNQGAQAHENSINLQKQYYISPTKPRRSQRISPHYQSQVQKYNYCHYKPPSTSLEAANNAYLNTFNTINSQSTFSLREPQHPQSKRQQEESKISYYTKDYVFSLDNEIAEDLKRYLGFQIDKI